MASVVSSLASWLRANPLFSLFIRYRCWRNNPIFLKNQDADWVDFFEYMCCSQSREVNRPGPDCFSSTFPREVCCAPRAAEEGGLPASDDDGAPPAPPREEEPWRWDAECERDWPAFYQGVDDLMSVGRLGPTDVFVPRPSSSFAVANALERRACGEEVSRYLWDGVCIRSRSGAAFYAADASRCRRHPCRSFADLRLRYVAGRSCWSPPPRALVAIAWDGGRSLGAEDYWEVVLVPRKVKRDKREPKRGESSSPPSLYIIALDSTSRMSLRHLMPKTHEYLTRKAAAPANYTVSAPDSTPARSTTHSHFNFTRYHTASHGGTINQLSAMLLGGLRQGCGRDWSWRNITRTLKNCMALDQSAVSQLRRAGYRAVLSTSFAPTIFLSMGWTDACPILAPMMGHSDHNSDLLCMGHQHYYKYHLQWNWKELEEHIDRPLFIYSHFHGRHRRDVQSLTIMDESFRNHIIETEKRHPNLIIVVMSDHGVVSKSCDTRAPMLHLLMPNSLLKSHPRVIAALHANTDSLVSPWDIFATLQHLPMLGDPEGAGDSAESLPSLLHKQGHMRVQSGLDLSHAPADVIELNSSTFRPQSVFEPMPSGRDCRAAGINFLHCATSQKQSSLRVLCAPSMSYKDDAKGKLTNLTTSVITALCTFVQPSIQPLMEILNVLSGGHGAHRVCKEFTFRQLHYFSIHDDTQWFIHFSVNEGSPFLEFQAHFTYIGDNMDDVTLRQVTRWHIYKTCTPDDVHPQFCVCTH